MHLFCVGWSLKKPLNIPMVSIMYLKSMPSKRNPIGLTIKADL